MKPFLNVLQGQLFKSPPLWLMRQAGRYLPEYRHIRQNFDDFMTLCYTPDVATEITLQPIKRFGFDAAILFSDILVIPDKLGQKVRFKKNHGPILESVDWPSFLKQAKEQSLEKNLSPVFQTIRQIKQELPNNCSFIGFAGSPWTLATYMIEEGKSSDFQKAITWITEQPDLFADLMNTLTKAVSDFLLLQISAGVECVQIFDTWASVVPKNFVSQIILDPIQKIIKNIRKQNSTIPIIYYGRGMSDLYQKIIEGQENVAVSVDHFTSLDFIRGTLQPNMIVQGNLSPDILREGGEVLVKQTQNILNSLGKAPFVFNLGHGILPDTPLENVYQLVEQVRSYENA